MKSSLLHDLENGRRLELPWLSGAMVHGRRAITTDTALRLARAFSMESQFWMNLQSRYDLETATDTLQARIEAEVAPLVA